MGRILEYAILLGNLSLILGALNQKETFTPSHYGPDTRQNSSYDASDRNLPKDDFTLSRRIGEDTTGKWLLSQSATKPKTNEMPKTPGLSSYMVEPPTTSKRRAISLGHSGSGFYRSASAYSGPPPPPPPSKRGFIPPYSQKLLPFRNYNQPKDKNTRLTPINSESKSFGNPIAQASQSYNSYQRYNNHIGGRNSRYFHHQRQNSKVCDPCNSVPWVPLLDVPASYRKERNQHFAASNHLDSTKYNSYDYHAVSSDTHNFVLPSSPLVPPTPTVLDGTISSSFGLPVGNIPTGHGLLAPLNHFLSPPTPDYSTAATFYSPPSLLDGSPIPELSPVPIVPVYDSGQFYSGPLLDSSDIGLVPPTINSLSVSNVVFTISEGSQKNEHDTVGGKDQTETHDKINFKQNTAASETDNHAVSEGSQSQSQSEKHTELVPPAPPHPQTQSQPLPQQPQHQPPQAVIRQPQVQSFGGIEIVKSVPLAEFTTGSSPTIISNQGGGQIQNHISYSSGGPSSSSSSVSNSISSSSSNLISASSSSHLQDDLKTLDNNPSSYLVPPPKPPHFNFTFNAHANSVFNDARHSETEFQASFHGSNSVPKPLTGPSASWLFADLTTDSKITDLKPPQPLITEPPQIASIVNSEFRPIPSQVLPISQGPDNTRSKKVQIIIPYTTKPKNELDTNSFESVRHEVFQTLQSLSNKSQQEYAAKFEGVQPTTLELNKTGLLNRKNENSTTFNHKQEVDRFKNPKYVAEMQHILAKNIKELLYREIEKSPVKQNYPLQNNIDNWTALEYSNHQTVTPKESKEVISQALSVTSIPGTSLSHTLLPSKKIPDEYFVSTVAPVFDETLSTLFRATNASVYSRPFTPRPQTSNVTNTLVKLSSPSPFTKRQNDSKTWNHENNYTVVGKSRVNYWGKLNENLVLPEKTHFDLTSSGLVTSTTASPSFFLKTDKVDIVTPVSVTTRKVEPTRRTTRHVRVTERTIFKRNQTRPFPPRLKPPPPSIKALNATAKAANTTKSDKPYSLTNNFAELKKLQIRGGVHKRVKNQTEVIRTVSSGIRNQTIVSRSNSGDAINRNVTTTTTTTTTTTSTTTTTTTTTPAPTVTQIAAINVNVTNSMPVERPLKTNQSEEVSINDIIPFRNQVLPWVSDATVESDARQNVTRQRKSLIKQVKSRRPKRGVSEVVHSLRPHSVRRNLELGT